MVHFPIYQASVRVPTFHPQPHRAPHPESVLAVRDVQSGKVTKGQRKLVLTPCQKMPKEPTRPLFTSPLQTLQRCHPVQLVTVETAVAQLQTCATLGNSSYRTQPQFVTCPRNNQTLEGLWRSRMGRTLLKPNDPAASISGWV